jgi:outer membrane protein assembly factor BamB
MRVSWFCIFGLVVVGPLAGGLTARAADQPQYGQAWGRNMVSTERGLPDRFDPKSGENVKWVAKLGSESHSTPVIAGGRVYLGTNNEEPRDPKHQGDRGVLLCLDEQDGRLLWQLVVPKREEDIFHDWPKSGLSSPATVEGDRVYVVDNRGVVLCLDVHALANGNDGPFRAEGAYMSPRGTNAPAQPLSVGPLDADILWQFDLTAQAGIWSHDAAHSSILIHGDHLYLNTGTGVDHTHKKIRTPAAPSLVVLDKRTGRYLAQDGLGLAPRIFHCTWSSPALARIEGRERLFFAGGDGILYGFEPLAYEAAAREESLGQIRRLKSVWSYDPDPEAPKDEVHRFNGNRATSPSNIYGMPVVEDGLLYLAGGGDWFWGKHEAWLHCVDPQGSGPTPAARRKWSYKLGRHTMSTPAVAGGMVFVADSMRGFHCVDARTGEALWTQELGGEVWGSALVADGKVYVGTRRGDFWVFALSREKKLLHRIELGAPISATPVAANGVLYVGTMTQLLALQVK